jgi:Rrf2 family transcriptional regulator, iron-sulfur cluster assembly transcription factor
VLFVQESAMRMSTKGRFAVNAMIDLALREASGPVSLAAIAARQEISLSYLEQLFSRMRQQRLVNSTRGPGGGYTLGRGTEAITVADIVGAVDDEIADAAPGESAITGAAAASELWQRLNGVMREHMATISLKSLVDEQLSKGVSVEVKPTPRRAAALAPVVKKPVHTRAPNSVFAFGRSFAR